MGGTGSKRGAKPAHPLQLHAAKESAPSRAVWVYLAQSKVPFELTVVDLSKGETKSEKFTQLNPHQCVPVLKDGDVVVCESQAIIRYVAHRYSNFFGMGHGGGKNPNWQMVSAVDSAVCWLHTTFYRDVLHNFVAPSLFPSSLSEEAKKSVVESGEKNTRKHLDTIEKVYLANSEFFVGNQPTVADYFAAEYMCVLELKAYDFSPWPKVQEWFRRVKLLDGWAEIHEAHRTMAKLFSGVEPEQPEPPKPVEPPAAAAAAEAKEDDKPSSPPSSEEKPAEQKAAAEEKPAAEEQPSAEEKPAAEEQPPAEEKPDEKSEEMNVQENPEEQKPEEAGAE